MRLKEIKPGMVIHCKTQEEANMLCNAVGAEEKWKEYWVNYKYNTCYHIAHNGIYEYGMSSAFKGEKITEFSDLILPELTAEETLRIFGAICAGDGCSRCPFDIIKDDSDCPTFLLEHYKEAAEICAQWKSDHEKKEPEIETVDICRIIEIQPDGKKRCVHEEDLASGSTDAEIKIMVEAELKRYCMEHDGEFIAVHEVVSRVKR